MIPEVAERIETIRSDRRHGAGWLAREALRVLKLVAERSEAKATEGFQEELRSIGRELMSTRRSMAPIANSLARFIYEVSKRSDTDLDSLRRFACSEADELIRDSEEVVLMTAQSGAGLIEEMDRVMTCSYSSTVCRAFEIAQNEGKQIEVLIAESRSKDGKLYGEATGQELRLLGISAKVVPDESIQSHVSKIDKVLVGADSILADGSLINGTPTYDLALAAKEANIPFYPICETSKFSFQSHLELEEGFDRIPPSLLTAIITENGIVKPEKAQEYVRTLSKDITLLY